MRPTVGLAAARFADEPERAAALERERHVVDGVHVADLAQQHAGAHWGSDFRRLRTSSSGAVTRAPASDGTRRSDRGQHCSSAAARTCGSARWRSCSDWRSVQPGGMSASAGTTPSIAGSTVFARGVACRGTEAIRPRVYGWRGAANSCSTGACSATRPAYMTSTSSPARRRRRGRA